MESWKIESKKRAAVQLSNSIKRTATRPQLEVNSILDKMGIKYINEALFDWYCIDNYLLDYNLSIEVMGDFWHCNPIKYLSIKHNIQKKQITKDRVKQSYIINKYNIPILYLWEYDIIYNPDICKKLIFEFIYKQGILDNYHSFNYSIKNDVLILNQNLVLPYQDIDNNIKTVSL